MVTAKAQAALDRYVGEGATRLGFPVPIKVILELHWGYVGDTGKENGNYYDGLYEGAVVQIIVPCLFQGPCYRGLRFGL